jgi:hypothetical protein
VSPVCVLSRALLGLWLRGHARLSPAAAGQLIRAGRAREHLTAAADQGVDLGEVDRVLAEPR